jgi:hypothetical protein
VPEETDTGMGTSISETLLVWAKTETDIKNKKETTKRGFLMKSILYVCKICWAMKIKNLN